MARIHIWKEKLYIAANKNIFEFIYTIDGDSPRLQLLKDFELIKNTSSSAFENDKNEDEKATVKNDNSCKLHNQILASALSDDGTIFAVATTSKECFLYNIADEKWTELRPAISLRKAPTAITFDMPNKFVLLSDRAGYVWRYSFVEETLWKTDSDINDSDGKSCEGELLLGHVSMILDIVISDDKKFLISVDRDEKIRVSRYPQCFVIHRYCLGHTSYVNSVHSKNGLIFSSAGDGTLRVWNLEEGKQIAHCSFYEKKAIRCSRMFPNSSVKIIKFAVVFEESETVQIVTYFQEAANFETECMTSPDHLIDIVVQDDGIFIVGITKSAVVFGRIGGNCLDAVSDIGENVLGSLRSVKDALPSLVKKIGFKNVEDYKQRKAERMKKKRQKLSTDL